MNNEHIHILEIGTF